MFLKRIHFTTMVTGCDIRKVVENEQQQKYHRLLTRYRVKLNKKFHFQMNCIFLRAEPPITFYVASSIDGNHQI